MAGFPSSPPSPKHHDSNKLMSDHGPRRFTTRVVTAKITKRHKEQQQAMKEASSSRVEHRLRARQIWQFTRQSESTNSTKYETLNDLLEECDPGYILLKHLGWSEGDTTQDDTKWLTTWETNKGLFVTWVKTNLKKWPEKYDEEHSDAVPRAQPAVGDTPSAADGYPAVDPLAEEKGAQPSIHPVNEVAVSSIFQPVVQPQPFNQHHSSTGAHAAEIGSGGCRGKGRAKIDGKQAHWTDGEAKRENSRTLTYLHDLSHVRAQLGGRQHGSVKLDARGRQLFLD
ncbi:hypothetical protein LX36DRAFT_738954 [Colletotrichum falcatum]|nr:hypothetical protein LX36DRAFT_738954 [Colletotrichum falcatum]